MKKTVLALHIVLTLLCCSTLTAATAPQASINLATIAQGQRLSEEGKALYRSLPKDFTDADKIHSLLMGRKEKYTAGATYPDRVCTLTGNNYWRGWLVNPSAAHNQTRDALKQKLTELNRAKTSEKSLAELAKQKPTSLGLALSIGGSLLGITCLLRLLYSTTKSARKRAAAKLALQQILHLKSAAKIKDMPLGDQRTIALAKRRIIFNSIGVLVAIALGIGGKYV